MAKRPAQGSNSKPVPTAKPRYSPQPGPKVVDLGPLSKPRKPPRPSYGPDAPPLRRTRD